IRDRYKHHYVKGYYFYHYIIAEYLSGWIGIGMSGVLQVGGRNGFCAFISNMIYIAAVHLVYLCCRLEENAGDIVQLEKLHHRTCHKIKRKESNMENNKSRNCIKLPTDEFILDAKQMKMKSLSNSHQIVRTDRNFSEVTLKRQPSV